MTTHYAVIYRDGDLWTLLSGPYESETAAALAVPEAWKKFQADAGAALIFPPETQTPAKVNVVTTPTMRPGAYGPLT